MEETVSTTPADQAQSSASAEPDHGPTAGALASDGPQEDRPKRPRIGNPRYTGLKWISKSPSDRGVRAAASEPCGVF